MTAKRVLRVITRLNAGGPSRHVGLLARHLDPARFVQRVVHGALDAGEAPIAPMPEGDLVSCPRLRRPIAPLDDLAAARRLREIIRAYRPDLVHTHQGKAGLLGRRAARREGVRAIVHTYHGHTFRRYWSAGLGRILLAVERGAARLSDALVAQSTSQRDEIAAALGPAAEARLVVIPPGVDFPALAADPGPAPPPREEGEVRVTFAARLAPVKNVEGFLEAFALVARERPEMRACVAGGGTREAEDDARTRAGALGIAERVRWLGPLDNPRALLASSEVLVCSSRAEGTPLGLLEGLHAGANVASFAVGGIADLIGGEAGVHLAPPDDLAALAGAIARAADEAGAVDREERRRRLERDFGPARLAADLTALYERLTGVSRPGAASR
ncbi:MAG: glycosyltransferase [Planctomycetota bacterium]